MKNLLKVFLVAFVLFPTLTFAHLNGAQVKKNISQSIPAGQTTAIFWGVDIYDRGNWHDDEFNETRMTVPIDVDFVEVCANVKMQGNGIGDRHLFFTKNGLPLEGTGSLKIKAANFEDFLSVCTGALAVVEGDYFETNIFHSGGSALDVLPAVSTTFTIREVH